MDIQHHSPDPAPLSFHRTPLTAPGDPIWVRERESLSLLADLLSLHPVVGLDTETGAPLPDRPLNDTLSLIQIFVPDEGGGSLWNGQVYLVDVLALGDELEPLREYLEDDDRKKVIHHAQFEREQMRRYGISLAGVIDTEKLSREARPDLRSHSLKVSLAEVVGLSISKDEQTSDWLRRPLTASQEEYAATDPFANMLLYEALRDLSKEVGSYRTLPYEELLALLVDDYRSVQEIRRPVANAYFSLDRTASLLRDEAKEIVKRLYDESGRVSGSYSFFEGTAGISLRGGGELDREKIAALHPELHASLPLYSLSVTGLKKLLSQAGIKGKEGASVIAELVVTKGSVPKVTIRPDFGAAYRGSLSLVRDLEESKIQEIQALLTPLLREDVAHHSLEAIADEMLFNGEERSAAVLYQRCIALKDEGDDLVRRYIDPSEDLKEQLQGALRGILFVEQEKAKLMRIDDIGNRIAPHLLRSQKVREAIIERVTMDNPSSVITTSHGTVAYEIQEKREVDIEALAIKYPSLFQLGRDLKVIESAKISKVFLKEFFGRKGLSNSEQDELVDALYVETSTKKTAIPHISPRYSLIYSSEITS